MIETKTTEEALQIAYAALDDKMAVDIKILDIREITVMADYFIIANGNNANHVRSLIEAVDEKLSKAGLEPKHTEGNEKGSWILLDYNDFVIHIFGKEDRYFYDLERIWADGKEVELS